LSATVAASVVSPRSSPLLSSESLGGGSTPPASCFIERDTSVVVWPMSEDARLMQREGRAGHGGNLHQGKQLDGRRRRRLVGRQRDGEDAAAAAALHGHRLQQLQAAADRHAHLHCMRRQAGRQSCAPYVRPCVGIGGFRSMQCIQVVVKLPAGWWRRICTARSRGAPGGRRRSKGGVATTTTTWPSVRR
jgi:hypothetical protein